MSGNDSRRHLRVRAAPSAPIRVDIMGRGFLEVLTARDISIGGLGVRVPHGFAGCDLDAEVELIVTLGRARPFKTRGAIRHHGKAAGDHLFGIEFTALSSEQRRAIEAYVESRLRQQALA